MMQITEKDGRLLVQFWKDGYEARSDGQIVMHPNKILDAEIDVTAHIERAVRKVMNDIGPVEGCNCGTTVDGLCPVCMTYAHGG